jgi:hypothetical protein
MHWNSRYVFQANERVLYGYDFLQKRELTETDRKGINPGHNFMVTQELKWGNFRPQRSPCIRYNLTAAFVRYVQAEAEQYKDNGAPSLSLFPPDLYYVVMWSFQDYRT